MSVADCQRQSVGGIVLRQLAECQQRLDHALTSEKEATAMLKARCKELDIVFDKTKKAYVYRVHES